MSDYNPTGKKEGYFPSSGEYVRVVLEGQVREVHSIGGFHFTIGDYSEANNIIPKSKHVKSIEKITAPEPEWGVGSLVQSRTGGIFLKTSLGWIIPGFDAIYPEDYPARPLTRLVAEKK